MNNNVYKKSFDLFLKSTDEKTIIEKFIKKNILLSKSTKILDIGGGDGSLVKKISDDVKKTVLIEPNKYFYENFSGNKKIDVINKKWEDVNLREKFDFILAAYVVTYFSKEELENLIEKMYKLLSKNGSILILSVDSNLGSWRKIHTYFYGLIGVKHRSSDTLLKKIINKYNFCSESFKTYVRAKNSNEMLKVLMFDFCKYSDYFLKHRKKLEMFLNKNIDKNNEIVLEIVHNAYIINKK